MITIRNFILLLMLMVGSSSIAQTVTNFTLPNAANNEMVTLNSYASSGAVVLLFSGNACPYDTFYKERIKSLIAAYSGKVSFLLINSYIESEESVDQMKVKAAEWSVPYLADKDQTVLTQLNAHKSPEAFLLKSNGTDFTVIYNGAIDDNPQAAKDVRQNYLKDAIDKTLAGQTPASNPNRVMGCSIRRK